MTTLTQSRTSAPVDVPTREWRIVLTEVGEVLHTGRLKLDEGWLIITDRDEDGHYVVFAAPNESVLFVTPS